MVENQITQIRRSRGYTLSQLAERASISKSYLSTIERNINQNPSYAILKRIASALDVDIHVLLGHTPVPYRILDKEWLDFVQILQNYGIGKTHLKAFNRFIAQIEKQRDCQKHETKECISDDN